MKLLARNAFNVFSFWDNANLGVNSGEIFEFLFFLFRNFDRFDQFFKFRFQKFSNRSSNNNSISYIFKIDNNVTFLLKRHFHDNKFKKITKDIINREIKTSSGNSAEPRRDESSSGVTLNNFK